MTTNKQSNKSKFIVPEDIFSFKIPGKAVISPDARSAIFPVQWLDKDKKKYFSNLWLASLKTKKTFRFTYGYHNDFHPLWSPNGKSIAFLSDRNDQLQIWKINTSGGEAVPLTSFEKGSLSNPVWSPDGNWIAIVFQEKTYIGVPPIDKHNKSEDAIPKKIDWEKWDKEEAKRPKVIRKLIYKANGAGLLSEANDHIWLVNAKTGEKHQMTKGPFDNVNPTWFPDSKNILFVSNRTPEAEFYPMYYDLIKMNIETKKEEIIETPKGLSFSPSISPDGSKIAYVGHDNPDTMWSSTSNQLWLKDLVTGKTENLTEQEDRVIGNLLASDLFFLDQDSAPQWDLTNSNIFYTASEKGACHLFKVNISNKKSTQLSRGPLDIRSFSISPNRKKVVITRNNLNGPAQICCGSLLKNVRWTKITNFNETFFQNKRFSKPEELWFDFENTRLQAWLLKPPDFDTKKKYPLILEIHGGPHILYGYNFFFEFQYLAAKGFVILYLNPRGSQGYGQEFVRSTIKDWGGNDYKDIMYIVNEIAKKKWIDEKKLGVTGGSYGGFMTNWIIGHTNQFAAAVTQRSVVNIHSMFGTSDAVNADKGVWGGYPWENFKLYKEMSPLNYVNKIKTPLLIIHSENDFRCPIEQAEQLFISLKHLKQEVEFVRYPGENHELSRSGIPEHRIDRLQRIYGWFEKFLLKSSSLDDKAK